MEKIFLLLSICKHQKAKRLFWFTFGQSKHTKLLIFNGVLKKIGEGVCPGADSVSLLGPFFQVRLLKTV